MSRNAPEKPRRGQLWKCPECGREFAKPKQWHSCAVKGLDDHFRGRDPHLRGVFDVLVSKLEKIGPVKVDPVKTSINLTAGRHLGAVTVRGSYLRVGFYAPKRIIDPRIVHFERLGPDRFGHSVVLEAVADVDEQLMEWLAAAYAMRGGV
ncbi:MAG TPA: DUF5655 domain-containing protein [Thermoanaerobaculia bacterium]|nr:DUF5655 domain-containing protein [Thermoanaerobaculia bacterium]